MEVVVTAGAIRRAKLQSNRHHQQNSTQIFFFRPDALLVAQSTVSEHWSENHLETFWTKNPSNVILVKQSPHSRGSLIHCPCLRWAYVNLSLQHPDKSINSDVRCWNKDGGLAWHYTRLRCLSWQIFSLANQRTTKTTANKCSRRFNSTSPPGRPSRRTTNTDKCPLHVLARMLKDSSNAHLPPPVYFRIVCRLHNR